MSDDKKEKKDKKKEDTIIQPKAVLNWKEAEATGSKAHKRSASLETSADNSNSPNKKDDEEELSTSPKQTFLKAHVRNSMHIPQEVINSQSNRPAVSPPPNRATISFAGPNELVRPTSKSPPPNRGPSTTKKDVPKEPVNLFCTDKGKDFLELLQTGLFSDIQLIINTKSYAAHKLVLSYSSGYFSRIFSDTPLISELKLPFDDTEDVFHYVLYFLYGGNLVINEANAIPLLAISDSCQIDALKKLVSSFLTAKIRRDNSIQMLKRAVKSNVKEMVDKCLYVIAKHFCYIYNADYSFLPYELFIELLKHPYLNVKDEFELYTHVCKYVEAKKSSWQSPNDSINELYKYIRYRFITYKQLEEVIKNPDVPRELIVEAGMSRLAEWEKADTNVVANNKRLQHRVRQSVTLDYSGDGKGILHWIGTNCEKEPWQNPATRGVKVTASSIERGQPMDLVRKLDTTELWTKDVPASWFCIDLGEKRKANPTYYTLVHGGNYEADILRTWYFQGSNDGENWVALRKHTNDTSLSGKFESFSWPVEGVITPFRYFRILQTGHNSSNRNFLVLAGIEIFGELYEE